MNIWQIVTLIALGIITLYAMYKDVKRKDDEVEGMDENSVVVCGCDNFLADDLDYKK